MKLKFLKFLPLLGNISAFDLATWMVILFSVILSILAWNYIFAKPKKSTFSVVFFLKILLGQATNEIQNVRLITGAWVYAGLFLSYNYQGNNIDQLTTPFTPKKFETFIEILANNLTVYSLPIEYELMKSQIPIVIFNRGPKLAYNHVTSYWNPIEVTFGKMYVHKNSENTTNNLQHVLKRIVKIPASVLEMQNMLPFKYYVDTISKGRRDVFVETLSYILKLRSNLLQSHVEASQISQSKVAFGQLYQFWRFRKLQIDAEDYSRRRFGLIESGIMHLWNGWKNRLEAWNDTVEAEKQIVSAFKPISIEGNVVVIFYMDLALKLVCLCIFLCECIKQIIVWISHIVGLVLTELRVGCARCFGRSNTIVERFKLELD